VRKLASIAAVAISLFINATRSSGQQTPTPAWLNIVISAPVVPNQGVEGFIDLSTESFINDTCQPSGLDGIQVLSVQTGHNEVFHLHVYCRQDKATSTHYKVAMVPVPNHKVDETAKTVLGRPNFRVGPLYLGATGEADAILLIEKTQ
jgi:hypothetical protein